MQKKITPSKATVGPVKTGRNHQIPAALDRENNQNIQMCTAHHCCVKGHYHARTSATGATRRLKEVKKKPSPRKQTLCKVTFHIDCTIPGDHYHHDGQCVCAIRAAEAQRVIDLLDERKKRCEESWGIYNHLDLHDDSLDLAEENLNDYSEVDFEFAAFQAEEEVKTPVVEKKQKTSVREVNFDFAAPRAEDKTPVKERKQSVSTPKNSASVSSKLQVSEPTITLNTEQVLPSAEEKKASFEMVEDIELVSTPSHQRGEKIEPQQYYKISRKAYHTLDKKFPNPYLCVNFLNSAMACLKKEHINIEDHQVFAETVSYFINNTYLLQQACRSPAVVSALTHAAMLKDPNVRTFIQPATLNYSDYIRKLGLPVDHGAILRVYGEESKVPADHTYNGNWQIVNSNGFSFAGDKDIPIGMFKTQLNEFPKFYRTQFTRISGVNDFTLLDANGKNVSLAMSRLTKARPDESRLRENQLRILTHQRVDKELLAICSNTPVVLPQEVESTNVEYLARRHVAGHFGNYSWNPTWKYSISSSLIGAGFFFLYLASALAARLNYVTENYVTSKYNPFSFSFKILPEPSPKRKIYYNWFEKQLGLTGHFYSIPVSAKSPEAKFKKELSKPGKHGRLYVTYNESIINLGWFFTYLKSWFCVEHRSLFGHTPLCVSIRKALDENSTYDPDPPIGLNGQIFSDDMSFQYRWANGLFRFDADISSCDAGNTLAFFYLLATVSLFVGATIEMIRASYNRLKEAIIIRNPSNPKEFIRIKPKTIFQGSGCPETTIVNDVASISIALAMQVFIDYYNSHMFESKEHDYRGFFDNAPSLVKIEILQLAALAVGHVITVDEKKTPEELQFLKYSPFLTTTGDFVSVRNLGAILRSLGSCDGDITALMLNLPKNEFATLSFENKMELFMRSVVSGLVNEPKSIIMDALRERFPRRDTPIVPGAHLWDKPSYHTTTDRSTYTILTESYISRYGGTSDDWQLLADQIRDFAFGHHFTSPLIAAVMAVDYALPTEPSV